MSVQATFCATLVDEWARGGVTDAVICPGSRSTPLATALADRLRVHVRLDERSAAFFALGVAMASGRPAVVCVTSGTAAAELHPAVVEAHHARVPLIVCTADRPQELQDTGASQTIEQVGLFGGTTRWATAPGVPVEGLEATWRPLAVRALAESRSGSAGPGPVHLNLAFREPLTGVAGTLPPGPGPRVVPPGPSGPPSGAAPVAPLRGRGLIVAGGWGSAASPGRDHGVLELAERLNWPVFADPRSGCRVPGTIAAADAIVRTVPPLPETIVLLGAPWLSRAVSTYISHAARSGASVVVVDPWRQWPDPARVATEFHQCAVERWVDAAERSAQPCDPDWLAMWHGLEARAQAAIDATLGNELSEPHVTRAVYRYAAETTSTLVVSASMPVRDLESFAPAHPDPPRVLANRGVNGIDGVVSTAWGVAAAGVSAAEPGSGEEPATLALLGDLALLHDVSGLVNLPDLPCTFVVLDNGGGGIFSFLPQAASLGAGRFELLFGTPPTCDLGAVARGFGLEVREVTALSQLVPALNGPRPALVRVAVPGRAENVARHDALNEAVRLALL